MSFVVAVANEHIAYLAADRMLVSKSGRHESLDTCKIIPCSHQCAVGIAGDFFIARQTIQLCRQQGVFDNPPQILKRLKDTALAADLLYRVRQQYRPDYALIIANHYASTPSLAVVTLAEGEARIFQEPLRAGEFQFLFSNPADIPFDTCRTLCYQSLLATTESQLQASLVQLVSDVAKRSAVVNTHVDLWCSQPLSK